MLLLALILGYIAEAIMGIVIGLAIWIGMAVANTVVAAVTIIGCVWLWIAGWFRGPMAHAGWLERQAAWRVVVTQLPVPLVSLLMPLFVLYWEWLPPWFQYYINTPDDPDPADQGWNGENHEPQVIWVYEHAGPSWARIYWLQRNCCYGLAAKMRWKLIDYDTAHYTTVGNYTCVIWKGDLDGLMLRTWRVLVPGIDRYLVVYYGWALWRNLKRLVPATPGPKPKDPRNDMGGVPVLTLRLQAADPLADVKPVVATV